MVTAHEPCDLTPQTAVALKFVEREMPMNELAKRLNAEASNLTGVVDRLESRGLVIRVVDESDRRMKRVVLTDVGRKTLEELTRAFENFEPVTSLSASDQATLRRILRKADSIATNPLKP